VAWRVRVDALDGHKSIAIGACPSERAQELAQRINPHHDEGCFAVSAFWGSGFQVWTAGKPTEDTRGQGPFFEAGGEATVELDSEAGSLIVRSSLGKHRPFELPKGKQWRPVVILCNDQDSQARATLLPAENLPS